jgi:uncharacterized protein YbaP (TraB family)
MMVWLLFDESLYFEASMHFLKKIGFTLLAAATLQSQAASVWKVTSSTNTLYIGGTIHLLTPQDYPLPKAYETAYQASDKIIFETNMDIISAPSFQQDLRKQMIYTDGSTIDKVLPSNTYDALKTYLESRQIPITAVESLKPSSLAISLSMIELKHLGFTSEGVDMFYSRKATLENKPKGWLEEPEEQISALNSLNTQDDNQVVEYALSDVKDMPSTMNKLRNSWRTGDMKTMAELEIEELKSDYPDVYESLIIKRNNLWIPQIEAMLNDTQVEFIMVGAMHLAGPDSVLEKLKSKGYQVSQLSK